MRFIISFIIMIPIVAFSQEKATFSLGFNDEALSEALITIENVYNVRFSYENRLVENSQITLIKRKRTLNMLLDEISVAYNLKFNSIDDRYIVITALDEITAEIEQLEHVIINSYLTRGISKNKNATFLIRPEVLDILPGLTEPDVLESIQQLPGVVSTNETASSFSVRGGVSDQNRMIWDGINMYHKGHLFGMISPFNPNATQLITFINKGTHPRYGERTSSVIDITSNSEISNQFKAELGFNAINADVLLKMPILKDKLSIEVSLRRSYTELYQSFTFDQLAEKVFQSTKIEDTDNASNDFSFLDYTVKINYKPNRKNTLYFSAISVDNTLDFLTTSVDDNQDFNDVLKTKNDGYGLGWNTIWNDKLSQHTNAYFSKYKLAYNFITSESQNQVSDFEKRNVIYDSGISTELIFKTNETDNLTAGYQYVLKDVGYAFINREELEFVLDSNDDILETHSVYANYDYKNSKLFNANIGVRASYFKSLDAFKLEPRILLYKSIFKNLKLQVSGEIKHQIISEIDETVLSDLTLENKLWRLADGREAPIIRGSQISAGLIYKNNGWTFDVDHYYKNTDNLTALSLGFLNPTDTDFHIGNQRTVGVDVFVKKDIQNFKTWIGYSFTNVENKYDGINDNKYFTANTSIRHALNTSVSYNKGNLQLALGWTWQTGKPYTKSIEGDNGIEFIGVNTEQLPSYHRLDFSSTYDFVFSKNDNIRGKIGLSIRNIYNRENQLSREYTGNNSLDDPIEVIDKFSLGITPNLLFRVSF